MSITTPPPRTSSDPREHDARMAARRSLLMLPVFLVVFLVTGIVGEYVVLGLLGLGEGSLFLMEGGVAGWAAEIAFDVLLLAAPVAGVWFAVRGLHDQGRWLAWTGLVLNVLLILVVTYMFVDSVRMSFFAPLD